VSRLSKEQLLEVLGYSDSPNYRSTAGQHHPLTAHLFREARRAGAEGAYFIHTSPNDEVLPPRPAVYVAEADTREEAREIHRSLWNLGNAPFLIVLLPYEVRVYTGFDYDQKNQTRGLIEHIEYFIDLDLGERLADYNSDSIDSGRLWANQASYLKSDNRLDSHLLRNLRKLEGVLLENGLELETAHALIGKYVYIRYLWDRKILSEQWLAENMIEIDSVLGHNARLKGLRKLVEALDERFNGHIFPLPLRGSKAPTDDQVNLVASMFEGDDPISGQMTAFGLYDFSYIPVETLSAIYEQFLHSQGKRKQSGAVYTPEHLADYVLAELNYVKPLGSGMRVLDPCCGSGIFLVLAYRKLIELELSSRHNQKLLPTELRAILTKNIFGVERNREACLVTELSLILTMLHYISPPELHRNKQFKFPPLHNEQIFEADFFDDSSAFWQKGERFDWIIGNPPWIRPKSDNAEERHVLAWINDERNRSERPVAENRVVEAFTWRTGDLLNENGCIGLVIHATSLFNHKSKNYRQTFFKQHEVHRVSNFANFSYVLFNGRGEEPAATIIYRKASSNREKPSIVHNGPFLINQFLTKYWNSEDGQETWILTINEDEVKTVDPKEAEAGDLLTWKLALWGTYRDRKALQKLQRLFTTNLKELVTVRHWSLHQGIELRDSSESSNPDIIHVPELEGREYFDDSIMIKSGHRFSIPENAFPKIPKHLCYIRKQGGRESLKHSGKAHLIFNAAYFVFSDRDFVFKSRRKRLSAPLDDADELRALSVYFSSSIAQYCLFFLSPSWGVGHSTIYGEEIQNLPVPTFTDKQIRELTSLQKHLAAQESRHPYSTDALQAKLQELLDERVARILGLPATVNKLASDFIDVRLSINKGKTGGTASGHPQQSDLLGYGKELRNQLDDFTRGRVRHKISFVNSPDQDMVVCEVELVSANPQIEVSFVNTNGQMKTSLSQLRKKLRQKFSQWIYVQRNLRIFDGPKVYICKGPRLIDWTTTQALNDADDLIAEVLSGNFGEREVAANGGR